MSEFPTPEEVIKQVEPLPLEGEEQEQRTERQLDFQEKLYNFLNRKEAKEQRTQVEELSQELFDRVDREKLLGDPELIYSAEQYRELLSIRAGVAGDLHNIQGYIENVAIRNSLEGIKRYWGERGFLKDKPESPIETGDTEAVASPESLADKRETLRKKVETSFSQRDKYFIRLRNDDFPEDFASEIDHIMQILNLEEETQELYPTRFGYPKVEYDNAFLNSVSKRTKYLFEGHRQAVKEWITKQSEGKTIFDEPYSEDQNEYITEKIAPRF
jgi:hypothetical protein